MLKNIKGIKVLNKKEQSSIKAGNDGFGPAVDWLNSCDGYATLTAGAFLAADDTLNYNDPEGYIVYTIMYEEAYNNCLDGNI
ncbi:hypothetical protein EZY14_018940 [Kordia sp. TARA_039_SRF]|nr:hypothetical protein EZY14_018940 [Kordia sp. TARA_039_SRF]